MTNPFDRGGSTPTQQAPTTPPRQSAPSNGGFSGGVGVTQSDDPYSVSLPVGLSGIKMSDEGIFEQLLLVEPVEYMPSIKTRNGETDAFRVNILPLTGPLTEQLQENVTVWQMALKNELQKTHQSPNRWLLTYLHKGEAKQGQNAPYLFSTPDDNQMAIYQKWDARRKAAAGQ